MPSSIASTEPGTPRATGPLDPKAAERQAFIKKAYEVNAKLIERNGYLEKGVRDAAHYELDNWYYTLEVNQNPRNPKAVNWGAAGDLGNALSDIDNQMHRLDNPKTRALKASLKSLKNAFAGPDNDGADDVDSALHEWYSDGANDFKLTNQWDKAALHGAVKDSGTMPEFDESGHEITPKYASSAAEEGAEAFSNAAEDIAEGLEDITHILDF